MPNRIIRESLLESDRWIELHDNTARVCYLVLLLSADDIGNMEASGPRLRRLWREYGVDTDAKVSAVLQTLMDADLARVYEDARKKRHLHVPRFRQYLRHWIRRVPGSPWDDVEKIQKVEEKTQRARTALEILEQRAKTAEESRSHLEVKGKEVK